MVELTHASEGELGDGFFFSDLFQASKSARFTGAIRVRAPGDMAVFFRDGDPIHAGGSGFTRHHLGELLMRQGAIAQSQLSDALERQTSSGDEVPLLGRVLTQLGVDPSVIERAMRAQVEARTLELFGALGSWQSAPGENARVRDLAVSIETKPLLLLGLRTHATEEELRSVADALLGKSVRVSGSLPHLPFDDAELKVIRYLDKPRKPDHLERATSRRVVRVVLRALMMMEKLTVLPAKDAIPIAKATNVVAPIAEAAVRGAARAVDPVPEPTPVPEPRIEQPAPPRAASSPRREPEKAPSLIDPKLVEEVKQLHKTFQKKTYFELLGIKPETPGPEVRKAFTALAKKYHPDAFVDKRDADFARMVEEISARINEAYQTLSNDKTRKEYLALLSHPHIQGDAQKADLIKDADAKHQKALVHLRKMDFASARALLEQATKSYPESCEIKATLAWSIFADVKIDREKATTESHDLLSEALKDKNAPAIAFYYMGEVCKARNEEKKAVKYFTQALTRNPKLIEAERELRLIRSRMNEKPPSNGGFLSKLLKR